MTLKREKEIETCYLYAFFHFTLCYIYIYPHYFQNKLNLYKRVIKEKNKRVMETYMTLINQPKIKLHL